MIDQKARITLPLKQLLTMPACPPRWKIYDLYLFRDEQVTFYVGQSQCAFDRVWEHIKGGPKGHSIVGRFLLANWPRSAGFLVELLSSQMLDFDPAGNDPVEGNRVPYDLDAAERYLIEKLTPCFNVALNDQPVPVPAGYLPPNTAIKYLKNLRRMLREAGYRSRPSSEDLEWE